MQKEDRAFRRLVTEALVGGPQKLTQNEIRDSLGISTNMVADARKSVDKREKEAEKEAEIRPPGKPTKSRIVTTALQRIRRTTKFLDKIKLVRQFFVENSTPTSRKRDVVNIKVNRRDALAISELNIIRG